VRVGPDAHACQEIRKAAWLLVGGGVFAAAAGAAIFARPTLWLVQLHKVHSHTHLEAGLRTGGGGSTWGLMWKLIAVSNTLLNAMREPTASTLASTGPGSKPCARATTWQQRAP
jgi:hypothetical protein